MYYAEKEAKDFLKKNGFGVLSSFYIRKSEDIKSFKTLKFPVVVKIFGRKIIHKNKIGGVKLGVKNFEQVRNCFNKMKKIKGFEGVVVQEQVEGKEVFLGLKKTPEFEYVIGFGSGGISVEKKKDVVFRVIPLNKSEICEMIKESKISSDLNKRELRNICRNISKIQKLSKKFLSISELDINPLIVKNSLAKIVDARMVRE